VAIHTSPSQRACTPSNYKKLRRITSSNLRHTRMQLGLDAEETVTVVMSDSGITSTKLAFEYDRLS